MGGGNWVKIKTRDSMEFYVWEVYYGSDLLITEIDGEIL